MAPKKESSTTTTVPSLASQLAGDLGDSGVTPTGTSAGTVTPGLGAAAPTSTGAADTAADTAAPAPVMNVGAGSGIWPMLPSSLAAHDFQESVAKSKGTPKGYGKGDKEDGLSDLSEYVKIVQTLASNGDQSSVDQKLLNKIFSEAKVPRTPTGIDALVQRGQAALTAPASQAGSEGQAGYDERNAANVQKAYKQAWADMVKAGHNVIGIPPSLRNAPPMDKAAQTLKTMQSLPVSLATQQELTSVGFKNAGTPGYDLGDVLKDHDEFQKGAPGGPGTTGKATTTDLTGESYYNNIMTQYNQGSATAGDWVTQLQAAGYLAAGAPNTTPSDSDVGKATVSVMQAAAQANETPADFLAAKIGGATSAGVPSPGSSELAIYIDHIASQVGGPGVLSAAQIQAIGNAVTSAGGVDSAEGEDAAVQYVTGYVNANLASQVSSGKPPTTYNGWAGFAAENIRTAYASEGVPINDAQVAGLVAQTMASGPTSIYATGDQATTLAQGQARQSALNLYPSLAAQIGQNTPITTLAQPYFSTASNLLGIGTQEMSTSDPKWMGWATGGAAGAAMTPQQWATKLMTDPQYGYQNSAPAKAASSAAANGLLGLMGVVPQAGMGSGASLESAANPT